MTSDPPKTNAEDSSPRNNSLEDEQSNSNSPDKIETNGALSMEEELEKEPEWQDLLGSGSIMKKLVTKGEPNTRPQRQQKCTLQYKLLLQDETVVEENDNIEIELGDCEVVQGLDVALGLMDVGERCLLKIAPRLAFGAMGVPPKIPPDSTVTYDVELLSVAPEDDPETMPIQERKVQGNKKRERGNWWYGRHENQLAIQCYRRALDYLDEVEGGISLPSEETNTEVTDATLQGLMEDRISVCNNMAAAQIKLELYEAALNSLQTVLRCQPNNIKALFRKSKIHKSKNDLTSAMKCLKKAIDIDPNNADVQREIATLNKLIQKQKMCERELAKRMFSNDSKLETQEDKKEARSNILIWSATFAASFAIGLVGIAWYRLKFA